MASEWSVVRVKDVGKVIIGRTPPASRPEYWGECLPFLTPTDFDGSRTLGNHGRYLSTAGELAMRRSVVPYGVAVSCIGWQMGKSVFVPAPVLTNQQINTIIYDPGNVDGLFLYYQMRNRRDELFRLASGGSRTPILKKSLFEQLKLNLPPMRQQRAIARILGTLDDKIKLNRRMNQTLEALARALFQSWFVDFDPVTAKAAERSPVGMSGAMADVFPQEFCESPKGAIPETWSNGSIADLARYVNGRNFTKNATGAGRMVIRIAELNSGRGGSTVFNDVAAAPDNVAYPGDLLFSWSGSLGVYRWHDDEALINQHIFKVIPKAFPHWFVYFHLLEALPFFQGIASDKATTMGHIKREHLERWDVVLPRQEVLKAADRVAQPPYQKIYENERQSRTLAALRDALLPRLLSGELRVRDAEKMVEKAT